MPIVVPQGWEITFGPTTMRRARAYHDEGAVTGLRAEADGRLTARVQGTERHPYRVTVDVGGRRGVSSRCSCPVGLDCKHGAAAVLAALSSGLASRIAPRRPQTVAYVLGTDGGKRPTLVARFLGPTNSAIRGPALDPAAAATSPDVSPQDAAALALMAAIGRGQGTSVALDGAVGWAALETAAATGRLKGADGRALRAGPDKPGVPFWDDDGRNIRLAIGTADGDAVLHMAPLAYLSADGEVGRVSLDAPEDAQRALIDAGWMPRAAAGALAAVVVAEGGWAATLVSAAGTPPEPTRVGGPPSGVLRVGRREARGGSLQVARVSFRYDGTAEVPFGGRQPPTVDGAAMVRDDRGVVLVERDRAAEEALARALPGLGLRAAPWSASVGELEFVPADDGPFAWAMAARRLTAAGWPVVGLEAADGLVEVAAEDVAVNVSEGSGIDWFDVGIGIRLGGEEIDLAALLAKMAPGLLDGLGDTDEVAVPLGDGRAAVMTAMVLRPLVSALRDILTRDRGGLRLPRVRAAEASAILAAGARSFGADRLLALSDRLSGRTRGEVALPPWFAATLRPYQEDGVAWMSALSACGFGGILADDMGLGKTVQALAWMSAEKQAGRLADPVLVVAPTSLMGNWEDEAARHAPGLRVAVMHGAGRDPAAMAGADLVLTTYALLRRDRALFAARAWRAVMLDEAGNIKNDTSDTFAAAMALRAGTRFCLTGTPIENNLGELWALMGFAVPGLLGDKKSFSLCFRRPIEKGGDRAATELLRRRCAPFLLRRTKDEVAADLPLKTEIVEWVDFGGRQRGVYEAVRAAMDERVRTAIAAHGVEGSGIVVLDALGKMRRACCDPRLIEPDGGFGPADSAKLEFLRETLPQMIAEGRRVLLFSQFTDVLDLVEETLREMRVNWDWSRLDGTTRNRRERIRRFRNGDVPLFLISLKAGGVGLNLVEADTVVLFDPWWNPAVEAQAIDRAHRIGQDKPVFVFKVVARDSIEEKLLALKEAKQKLADSIIGDEDGGAAGKLLDAETIAELMAA